MKTLYVIMSIVFSSLYFVNCTEDPPTIPPVSQTGSIYGIIKDSVTHLPIENSIVFATNTKVSDTTDQYGNFLLKKIKFGSEILQVSSVGYNPQNKTVEISSDSQFISISLSWLHGSWVTMGLENKYINRLRIFNPFLYACTRNGLWRINIQNDSSSWQNMSFTGNVSDVIVNSDNSEEILVASQIDDATKHGIYKTYNEGQVWSVSDNGLEYDLNFYSHPGIFCNTSYDLFAASYLVHTNNFGVTWEVIHEIGVVNDFRCHNLYDNNLWIGGKTVFGGPILYFSNDSGKTWEYNILESFWIGDDAIFSVAFEPTNPSVIYASMFDKIIKTTNGGSSWSVIFSHFGPGFILSIVEDGLISNRLFAGTGLTARETRDGGLNWIDLKSPNGSGITTMIYNSENNALYIGTGDGPSTPNGVFIYITNN